MAIRIVKDLVVLYRDGKQITPDIGSEFDFTAEELASINKSNPMALAKPVVSAEVLSAPVVEKATDVKQTTKG